MYTDPSGYQYMPQEEDTKFKWSFQDEMARTERELGLWNGGNTSIYSYLSAFNKAFQNGYKSDFTQFMGDVDKQASNSDFNGQLTFSYTTQKKSTAKFGKERIGNLEFEFTEFIVYPEVKRSITINLWDGNSTTEQDGIDGMDIANYIISNSGTLVGGVQYGVNSMKNSQLWRYSYKASKYLNGKGINVQTRVIKHGLNGVLNNASRNITYIGLALSVADVAIDGKLKASHILNVGMVGVSAIPFVGWIIGGGYFVADMITIGVSRQSIGQHLDNAVGNPLIDDIYNW